MTTKIKAGDIIYVNLNGQGHEFRGVHPCLVIQNNIGNERSKTTIIAPITSNIKNKNMPTHFIIENYKTVGLKKKSKVLFEQIQTIDKKRILRKIGCFPENFFAKINRYLISAFEQM